MNPSSLEGISVVSFESRLSDLTAQLIEKYGGRAIRAPSMQEVPLEQHEAVFTFAEALFAGNVDILICLTGVGTRMLVETLERRFDRDQIVQALSNLVTVARGPKPVRALKDFGIPVTLKVPEPNTWRELLQTLDASPEAAPLKEKRTAIQEYGQPNEELVRGLEQRGAHVIQVPIYRWTLPEDQEPLKQGLRALIEGRAQVALFTSRTQIDHVMQVAAAEGWDQQLRAGLQRAVVASIGPICTEGLQSHGIPVDFEPEHPKLGVFIRDLAREAPRRLGRFEP